MKEAFTQLLSNQPQHNGGIEETKINIHIPIRGQANKFCLDINEAVRKLTMSDIDFSPDSFQVPHITLYSGYVNSNQDFSLIMTKVYELSLSTPPFKIKLTQPYFKEPSRNYLFVNTNKTNQLIKLKEKVKSLCGELITPLNWDVVAEIPHITLAFIQDGHEEVSKMLSLFNYEVTLDFDSIGVSYCGIRGTCIGTIRTFELEK